MTMALIGGAAAVVALAVGLHYMSEKSSASHDDGEEEADIDDHVNEIGAIERDQQGMIKWE